MFNIRIFCDNDSFTSSFGCLLFHLVWLLWLGLPVLCWMIVVKMNNPVLFLILKETLLGLYCVKLWSIYDTLAESFYHKWVLDFIKCFFLCVWIWSFDFHPTFWLCDVSHVLICRYCTNFASPWTTQRLICMIFLMYCWVQLANIFLRVLTSMFIRHIGL